MLTFFCVILVLSGTLSNGFFLPSKQIDNCRLTKECETYNSLVSMASYMNPVYGPLIQQSMQSVTSIVSQLPDILHLNRRYNFKCTNYVPTIKYNGCRADVLLKQNFNVKAFLGTWYVSNLYNFGPDYLNMTCFTDNFNIVGNSINLKMSTYYPTGNKVEFNLTLDLDTFKNGQMKFSLNGLNDVRIVSTDYTNYVIWYNCATSPSGEQFDKIEVAVRSSSSINASLMKTIVAELTKLGFEICEVGFVGRANCRYI